jgi:hypothetical protein
MSYRELFFKESIKNLNKQIIKMSENSCSAFGGCIGVVVILGIVGAVIIQLVMGTMV